MNDDLDDDPDYTVWTCSLCLTDPAIPGERLCESCKWATHEEEEAPSLIELEDADQG